MNVKHFIKERYFIKIVPARGDAIHRFEVTRRHIIASASALLVLVCASVGFGAWQVVQAHAQVAALRSLTVRQSSQLRSIASKTSAIGMQLRGVQKQDREIQELIGVKAASAAPTSKHVKPVRLDGRNPIGQVTRNVDSLRASVAQTSALSDMLRTMAMHVLNVRHIYELARAKAIAAIPSIDPVAGAAIVGCFCYRTYPDVEFHEGVDLAANYGAPVRAAAAGTIVSAGWDGGYGIKVDIDHGNGYHTWYAHLSRVDVRVGQHVFKGETIAQVGSTGFSTGPHVHYQVMLDGTPIDPTPYLHGIPAGILASLAPKPSGA